MSWLDLPRIPEPEVMDDSGEVEAYASAAAQKHLDRIDDTFVEHAVSLVHGHSQGRALDIGTGPGQIVLKLAHRLPVWQFVAVDHSPNMIRQARENLAAAADAVPSLSRSVEFSVADGNRLAFPDASFDLVMSNSVLHHLAEPQRLFAEVARLAKPGAAILLRDLRRPSRLAFPWHVRWHGRNYSGTMYQLFCASVRSAYTLPEMETLLRASPLRGARVFAHAGTHLGIARQAE
ncbi:MAG TPA: class I SAM-dependent methyltransferase [Candidatus Acidoferrales bacterium]|nr:class I SAM-dependent methyltransferase [Candidatus Acidoferrales bacterium]